jgi:ATP-dependent DNA helicase Q1
VRVSAPESVHIKKSRIVGEISKLDAEHAAIQEQITQLQGASDIILKKKRELQKQLDVVTGAQYVNSVPQVKQQSGSSSRKGVDYTSSNFEWSGELKARMRKVFGIQNFRLCQEG